MRDRTGGIDVGFGPTLTFLNSPHLISGVTPTARALCPFETRATISMRLRRRTARSCGARRSAAGVIHLHAEGHSKVATGYVSIAFPTEIRRAKIAILGVQ